MFSSICHFHAARGRTGLNAVSYGKSSPNKRERVHETGDAGWVMAKARRTTRGRAVKAWVEHLRGLDPGYALKHVGNPEESLDAAVQHLLTLQPQFPVELAEMAWLRCSCTPAKLRAYLQRTDLDELLEE